MLSFISWVGSLGTVWASINVPGRSVLGESIIDQDLVLTSWVCFLTFDWPLLVLPEL